MVLLTSAYLQIPTEGGVNNTISQVKPLFKFWLTKQNNQFSCQYIGLLNHSETHGQMILIVIEMSAEELWYSRALRFKLYSVRFT